MTKFSSNIHRRWKAKLNDAEQALGRAQRADERMKEMRDSYMRDLANLRQQLAKKKTFEERGDGAALSRTTTTAGGRGIMQQQQARAELKALALQ